MRLDKYQDMKYRVLPALPVAPPVRPAGQAGIVRGTLPDDETPWLSHFCQSGTFGQHWRCQMISCDCACNKDLDGDDRGVSDVATLYGPYGYCGDI